MSKMRKRFAAIGAAFGIAALASALVALIGPAVQACACEGEDPSAGWLQNMAGWVFFGFIIGVFLLSMVLFTIVMIRNSKRKQ
ncbi:hypothetical protein [Paenibacillus sp. MBLB4367]|uniref:hypothetical protein n=1 Tax=Paenibacillus sp. MBLB4367 TaxID=3384767 RepID=UPI003907FD32